jgi:uncharacterized protein YukE
VPDISVDYEKITAVSSQLNSVATNTVPKLQALQSAVHGLLDPSGGLWLTQSSPALNDKYLAFHNSVTQAVNNIPTWATQFSNIASTVHALDDAIAQSTTA